MKIKKKTLKIIGLIFIMALIGYISFKYFTKNPYSFKGTKFSYSEHRGNPEYTISVRFRNTSFDVYDVTFKSRKFLNYEIKIYGLLVTPHTKNVPGLVLLPGGGVTKESELVLASKIAELGYAVLTIDQRGVGQTDGYYLSFEQDYEIFSQGKEPIQHLSVFDALRAFDVLRSIDTIDKNNVALAGESMGGRYALIATALDNRIKGFIGISTAGFNVLKQSSNPENTYFLSIDSDNYIKDIAPRPIFMLHSTNDTKVPLQNAQLTFNLAHEPKKFYTVNCDSHGYCDAMYDDLKESLKMLFGK